MSRFFQILIKVIKYVTIIPAVIDAVKDIKQHVTDEIGKVKTEIENVKKKASDVHDEFIKYEHQVKKDLDLLINCDQYVLKRLRHHERLVFKNPAIKLFLNQAH